MCQERSAEFTVEARRPAPKYINGWAHSEHRFPAPSSKLCQIELRHWRGTVYFCAAVQRRGQRPPKGSSTNMTVEAT